MPVIYVIKNELFKLIGKSFTNQEFSNLCFEFGIEMEEGDISNIPHRDIKLDKDLEVYKIEVTANRVDLLSIEGLAYALRSFSNNGDIISHTISTPTSKIRFNVDDSVKTVRPYVVGAILRNMKLTE